MKNRFFFALLTGVILFVGLVVGSFFIERLLILWLAILVLNYQKLKNHFISMLLTLEILSITILILSGVFISLYFITSLIFVLIALRVGEAVLGLAILVKLVRWNSKELLSHSLG